MTWPIATTPASANGYVAPAQGEVVKVALRGEISEPKGIPSLFVARVLVLRPRTGGTVEVLTASADLGPKLVNVGTGAVTTIDMLQFPERLCVLPGDVVAFATSGGYDAQNYPGGVPVQMFARAPASADALYKVAAGGSPIQTGTSAKPAVSSGRELLMRVTVGTGTDARPFCRSADPTPAPGATPTPTPPPVGTSGPSSSPVKLPKAHSSKVRKGRVKLRVRCAGPAACTGRVALSRKKRKYGSAAFALTAGETERVKVKLSAAARRALKRAKSGLTVRVVATTTTGLRVTSRTILRR